MTTLDRTVPDVPYPDAARLAEQIRLLAGIGADPAGGVTRLAWTAQERDAHRLLSSWMEKVGLEVTIDAFGNTFGLRSARNGTLPAVAFGSHVDTVPNGGAYDGAAGTIAALEVMRLLQDSNTPTEHPFMMVIFAAEEGARFGKPNLGARAVVGELTRRDLASLTDARGVLLEDAVQDLGFSPDRLDTVRWEPGQLGAFFEMHIEQGQVLESERTTIGLVDTIAGSTRLRFTITGRAVHSGATPMHLRHDALAAAADLVLNIEAVASDHRHRATVATVGKMDVRPNSITTIAGEVVLYVDVRDSDSDRQREAANRVLELGQHLEEKRGVGVSAAVLSDASPSVLPTWLRHITAQACDDLNISYRVVPSGAGHDASVVSSVVPAAMIFVPSQGGISHAPEEWSSPEDIAAGAAVLCRSALALDRFLASQSECSAAILANSTKLSMPVCGPRVE